MADDDRIAQVPASRIRDAVDSAMQKHAWGILLPLQDQEFTAVVEDITAAVAALLSQPTPTAEPERAWVAAVLRRAGCTFSDDGPVDELFDLFAGRTVMAETSRGRLPPAVTE